MAEKLARGELTTDREADDLEDVLCDAILEEGYDPEHGLTALGIDIDYLIGICRQHCESFYRDEPE